MKTSHLWGKRSGVITLTTVEPNTLLLRLNIQFSASLCFILSCPKRAFTSIYFRCVLPKQTAFISWKGCDISSSGTLSYIFVPSPATYRSVTFGLAALNADDLKMAAIPQRRLQRSSRPESFERFSMCTAGARLLLCGWSCETRALAKA